MKFATYVINLEGSDARLAHISAQLNAQGIPFQRVPAFDGRQLAIEQFPNFDAKAAYAFMGRPMRGGEVGCYLSHLKALRAFLDSDARYAVILEDDAELAPGLAEVVGQIIDWTRAEGVDFDVVNLGAEKLKYHRQLKDFGGWTLEHAFYFPMRATGMLWSRAGAEDFLHNYAQVDCPVDNQYRNWQSLVGRGLAVKPWVVLPSGAASDIDAGRAARNIGERSRFYGLIKQRRIWGSKLQALRTMRKPNLLAPRPNF